MWTTEGVYSSPSLFRNTFTCAPLLTAIALFVVPRSIPKSMVVRMEEPPPARPTTSLRWSTTERPASCQESRDLGVVPLRLDGLHGGVALPDPAPPEREPDRPQGERTGEADQHQRL